MAIIPIFFPGCTQNETVIKGKTMGTTYMVKVMSGPFKKTDNLKKLIDERLKEINASMSTYIPDSEISRFNSIDTPTKQFEPTSDFLFVMKVAASIHSLTNGAWDASLDPLITLWGFGRDKSTFTVPKQNEIKSRLKKVGFNRISITDQDKIIKTNPDISIDLASIAKGYGVDQVAKLLKDEGFDDFLVEIGGEVYASGEKLAKKNWRVGINRPDRKSGLNEIYKVVELKDKAFATSGDYRNYFEAGGEYYSHIIDPRTGYPVTHGIVSASVIASNCTLADGLATALMVMEPQEGLKVIEKLKDVEALIILRLRDGNYGEYATSGFRTLN